jgi:hypothetical protein
MRKYDLHDSLIEEVDYYGDKKSLEIRIELCNWKQSDYKDTDPEMLNMCITFEGVEKYELSVDNYRFNSNEILEVAYDGELITKIVFLTQDDAETIIVLAKSVSYSTQ